MDDNVCVVTRNNCVEATWHDEIKENKLHTFLGDTTIELNTNGKSSCDFIQHTVILRSPLGQCHIYKNYALQTYTKH